MHLKLNYKNDVPTISFRLFFLRLGRVYSLSDYECITMPMLMPSYGKKMISGSNIPRSTFDLKYRNKTSLEIFHILELQSLIDNED